MNRVSRLLLRSPKSLFQLQLQHHLFPPPSNITLYPKYPQTLCPKHFSSSSKPQILNLDPFASLKCYAQHDPDTPYYVIDPGSAPRMEGRSAVPEELLASVGVESLECGSCHVYLVGLCRDEAAQDIKAIMNHLKPEVVFLGLCASQRLDVQKSQDIKAIQADNIVFRMVFEAAVDNGSKVILGDRPFQITVQRILESMLAMRIWEFTKLSFYLLIRFMEYGKENKVFKINDFVRQKLEELKAFPTLQKPAIHERDLLVPLALVYRIGILNMIMLNV